MIKPLFVSIISVCLGFSNSYSQDRPAPKNPPPPTTAPITNVAKPNPIPQYKVQKFANDPYNTSIYTLNNGLKVYISVNKEQPRIQTYIAVRAGGKNDPSDATGLAHYLEHMLFKGTDKIASLDYNKEKPLLDQIENLYEDYRATKDDAKRKKIYHSIDSLSGEAAKYSVANEYDRMIAQMGSKATNAHTSFEETVYHNDIPNNQFENWISLEAERFRNPVMRIFHTELEAVYEEKNRGLDSDGNKSIEALLSGLFKKHTYGTQTTIGTVEHLKNPSIKRINQYLKKYYIPNNMAICLSGDIDPEYAIRAIDKTFGTFATHPLEAFVPQNEDPILNHETYEVFGPEAESMIMGYRFNGSNSIDSDILKMMSFMLYNGKAGLLDMDLNLKQKVLESFCEAYLLKDYSILFMGGSPTQGQTLEEMQKLFLEEIEKLKKGDFPEWLPQATITNLKLEMMTELESNEDRASALVDVFIKDESWEKYINTINRLSKITKQQIVDFAKNNMNDNYVLVYKRSGEDKKMVKVSKPEITPVETNRDKKSDYAKNFNAENVVELKPEFIDFSKEINKAMVNGVEMYAVKNPTNTLFKLDFILPMGSAHNKLLPIAFDYILYAGTSKMSAENLQTELFKLGCDFVVSCEENQSKITITGLDENKGKAIELIELLIRDVQVSEEIMQNVIAQNFQVRDDIKKNKGVILQQAMASFAKYGATNPFNNVLSNEELKNLKAEKLVQLLKSVFNFKHQIHYYGPSVAEIAAAEIQKYHSVPKSLIVPQFESNFTEQVIKENKAIFVDFEMQQAELLFLSQITAFDSTLIPVSKIHNQYFGAGLNSVVGQTLRESKALAYSVFSSVSMPKISNRSIYGVSYIGTQADKLYEATAGMKSLLDTLPLAQDMFEETKKSIIQKTNSERISKKDILSSYYAAKQLGMSQDSRKATYDLAKSIQLDDLAKFHSKYIASKNISYLIIGKKDKILSSGFSNFAPLTEINKNQIFGF